jgi:S-adenosylmethionine:tRNA ribosyltransferase-isomerase
MKISDFDYDLPEECIAQKPAEIRDQSRLLVLERQTGKLEHRKFFQIVDFLQEGDALVINNTKVFPARLLGRKESGGKVEVLLLKELGNGKSDRIGFWEDWECLINTSRPLKEESTLLFDKNIKAEVVSKKNEIFTMRFFSDRDIRAAFEKIGFSPLPPYIKREHVEEFEEDRQRYQTIYATDRGAVAAPTAGLHFTESLLEDIKHKSVAVVPITLHINYATFRPVREENIEDHKMHAEHFSLSEESAAKINKIKHEKGKIHAVGTTVVRTLEFLADETGDVSSGEGENDLFIYPGFQFKVIDGLITNFHLPRSTLLMLVSAFASREHILAAYEEAKKAKYRFYSYGDAMFIT